MNLDLFDLIVVIEIVFPTSLTLLFTAFMY